MHAVVVTVNIDLKGDREAAFKHLQDNVVPGVSRSPGFVHGVWLDPDDTGLAMSTVTFTDEDSAKAAAAMAQQMFDSGEIPSAVTLHSIAVRGVSASA